MQFINEFFIFLRKYKVIGLAIALVIGTAGQKLVSATVNDLIMPVIQVLMPGGEWQTATIGIGPVQFMVGDFAGALIDFTIIVGLIFIIVKKIMKEEIPEK